MNWLKKKKSGITLSEVTNRIRGLILDSQIQDAHELGLLLGCSAISEDVQEREEEESDKRTARISYLIPLLFAHVHLLAEGAVEYQKSNLPEEIEEEIPVEVWHESRKMLEQVSMSAIMGSVSQLIDMGLLEIPRKYK
jgi:hypothetical protein